MAVRINITMPEEFAKAVDDLAGAEHRGRSELIREALRLYMAGRIGNAPINSLGTEVAAAGAGIGVEACGNSDGARWRGEASGKYLEKALRSFFASQKDVILAYLFGSWARGVAGRMSDLDVAVLLERGSGSAMATERRLEIMSRLGELLKEKRVDVLLLDETPPGLRFAVIKEGTPVFVRDEDARISFEAGTIMHYLDFRRVEKEYEAYLSRMFKG